jgi:hypothetical protein
MKKALLATTFVASGLGVLPAAAQQSVPVNPALEQVLNTTVIAAMERSVDFSRAKPVALDLAERRREEARMNALGAVRAGESVYVDRALLSRGADSADRDAIRVRRTDRAN